MGIRSMRRMGAPVLALSLLLMACSDDDDGDDAATTTAGSEETTTTGAEGGDHEELCALAQEMFDQEDFPTAEQLERYRELAPPEIEDAVSVAAPPLIAADGDPAAFFDAFAVDEVEAAALEIDTWELENCGIDHESAPAGQAEIDPAATRVDVVADEYSFEFPTELTAGPTSFVMTNAGQETHFMVIVQLAEGHTLDEALAFEGDPEEAGLVTGLEYDSGLAAVGGEDEEVITADLEPGSWAMLCFVSGPDGTPHAYSGMAVPFTVTG